MPDGRAALRGRNPAAQEPFLSGRGPDLCKSHEAVCGDGAGHMGRRYGDGAEAMQNPHGDRSYGKSSD